MAPAWVTLEDRTMSSEPTVARNDDAFAQGSNDGSVSILDSYLSVPLVEGDYLLAVGGAFLTRDDGERLVRAISLVEPATVPHVDSVRLGVSM